MSNAAIGFITVIDISDDSKYVSPDYCHFTVMYLE